MNIKNITNNFSEYREQIVFFLKNLDTELRYFNLTAERVGKSELILVAMEGPEIIGIAGLEKKYAITRGYILVKKDLQKWGFGISLFAKLLSESKRKYNIILGVVSVENITSLRMNLAAGYKIAAKRQNLYYTFRPFNLRGKVLFYLIKAAFPALKLLDIVRR